MNSKGIILIVFAWAMEIVGIAGGMINSTYTTFGEDLPTTFLGYIPAVPMVALAVAELGRVPLASVIFHKQKLMQGVAILGILALGYLAVENWTFGFERIVDLRLKSVNTANRELARAESDLAALADQRERMATSNAQKRDELRHGIDQRDSSIAGLSTQLSKEAEVHQKNLEGIKEACRLIREKCIVPRSLAEDARYAAEVDRLSTELARQRKERKELQSQIDKLVTMDHTRLAELDQKMRTTAETVTEARKSLRTAADGNQIYRLAASWYGVNTSEVTAEQFAKARWVFATFSAIAVALAGSIAALVYYARSRVPGAPLFLAQSIAKLIRARHAYYARKRRPLKIHVPGPTIVEYREGKEPPIVIEKEKLVDRIIDHIILIPRWGIWNPTYINSLIRAAQGSLGGDSQLDPTDSTSNVTQLKKKAN
jgi:hypothetical protein